ncbi:MAG: PhnE/PtxC family ABC transporter permease [Rhodomicrobium sp.]
MIGAAAAPQRLSYRSASLFFLFIALAMLFFADLAITALHPAAEFKRLIGGALSPAFSAVEIWSVIWTVAFAVLGVAIGGTAGVAMALVFDRFRIIRLAAAFLRSIHELFWALFLLQITGLSPATGILAIALPFTGLFAKVFAEIIEEADLAAERVLPSGTSAVSRFAFARLPVVARALKTYTLYRLECGMRSTLVLGFVGLPTIGFHLESYFKQGYYPEAVALLLCFYALIGTRRIWARPSTVPFLIIASLLVLPRATGSSSSWSNLARFGHDIIPAPLRHGSMADVETWRALGSWASPIITREILPGAVQTLILAQIALVAAAILALAVYPLVSRRFLGTAGHYAGRALLVVARSTPEYMLAYLLLQLMGPSMLPAIIALTLHNGAIAGYLLGRQTDELSFRADATKGANLYFFETTPRLYGQFLAYMLYRWEVILRESAIFGILGVRTLGYYVDAAISELRLDTAAFLLIAVAALSMSIDAFSRGLRRSLRIDTLPTRLSATNGPSSTLAR